MNWLLILVPMSLALHYLFSASPLWVFATSVVAIIPIADWIRKATEHLAHRTTPSIGGLLNTTFGNVTELVLAVFVLLAGHQSTAKAQITGSLVGNSLLGLGLAAFLGGIGRTSQRFSRRRAGHLSTLMTLVVIAIAVPAAYHYTERGIFANPTVVEERVSLGVACVLILIYAASYVYTFVTHHSVFQTDEENPQALNDVWPIWKSVAILLVATLLVALEAEQISGALEATSTRLGITPFFLGATVLAVVGNAAEYITAIYFARKNQMALVMTVTVGSTIQVGLLIAPALVLVSYFIGHPMTLVFSSPLELIAIAAAAFAVNSIAEDGQTTWFEGLFLLGIYLVLGIAFYFVA